MPIYTLDWCFLVQFGSFLQVRVSPEKWFWFLCEKLLFIINWFQWFFFFRTQMDSFKFSRIQTFMIFTLLFFFGFASIEMLLLCFSHVLSFEEVFLFSILQMLFQVFIMVFATDDFFMIFQIVVLIQPIERMLLIFW